MNDLLSPRQSSEQHRGAATRKLRKSCSLPTCTSPPGTCMHCTCDGRCGRHVGGRCGGRREGSGRGCKRAGCTRDERCLHSNRATCCHCRNLVSSSGRAVKRPRGVQTTHPRVQRPAMIPHVYWQQTPALPTRTAQCHQDDITTNDDVLEAELRAFLQDANLGGELALCEYKAWTSRRQYCNLVVLVCGTQFNLHKHPMLFESNKLHRMARQVVEAGADSTNGGTVPVLELSAFPGGAAMFETLAIYCYTGEISFSLANLAVMNCAIEFLEMRDDIRQSAKRFLDQQISRGSQGLSSLVQVVNAAQTLAQAQPELFHSACAALVEICMRTLVEREDMIDADTMLQLFTLPSELFVEFTHRVLSFKPLASPVVGPEIMTESCDQVKLTQLHRDAQQSLSPSHCNRKIAQQCVQLLQGNAVEAVDAVEVEKVESCEEEPLDPTMLFASERSDRMLVKIMDIDDLSTCVVSPASPPVDASICFDNDSFRLGVYARNLPETFVM